MPGSSKQVNWLYMSGYMGTLLIGSMQFGMNGDTLVGYNLTIYGSCIKLFGDMYEWSKNEKGGLTTPSL